MRHRVYGKQLGKNKDERDRLFKGLIHKLLLHGSIQTSSAKAKAIKGLVDKMITSAKEKKLGQIQSIVTDKALQERLVKEIAPKMANRTSGYTSMVRLGTRLGDQTMMVRMSLIGAEELKPIEKVTSKKIEKVVSKKKVIVRKSVKSKRLVTRAKTKSSKK